MKTKLAELQRTPPAALRSRMSNENVVTTKRNLSLTWRIAALLVCPLVLATLAAADTLTTFKVSGTFADGKTFGGSFTLDQTIGSLVAWDITSQFSGITYSNSIPGAFGGVSATQGHLHPHPGPLSMVLLSSQFLPNTEQLILWWVGTGSVKTFSGGPIIIGEVPGLGAGTFPSSEFAFPLGPPTDLVASGSASVVPEPSSLLLLGTGLLGVVGARRRRLRR